MMYDMPDRLTDGDVFAARYYFRHGPCCAGCDHWQRYNSLVGDCLMSQMVPGPARLAAIGIESCSRPMRPGHIMTKRGDVCELFRDTFDWLSLPLAMQKRLGQIPDCAGKVNP